MAAPPRDRDRRQLTAPRSGLLDTARGPARYTAHLPPGRRRPAALVILLHGAGTDTAAAPLPLLADLLACSGCAAVRFDQPYATAGRRSPDRAPLLDAVLLEAVPALRRFAAAGAPLGLAGRSSGARVACRSAAAAGAAAVACLGFPLRPPRRPGAGDGPDRSAELSGAGRAVPVLVLQGERDPFGRPAAGGLVQVELFPGAGHVPTPAMAARAAQWLAGMLLARGDPPGTAG